MRPTMYKRMINTYFKYGQGLSDVSECSLASELITKLNNELSDITYGTIVDYDNFIFLVTWKEKFSPNDVLKEINTVILKLYEVDRKSISVIRSIYSRYVDMLKTLEHDTASMVSIINDINLELNSKHTGVSNEYTTFKPHGLLTKQDIGKLCIDIVSDIDRYIVLDEEQFAAHTEDNPYIRTTVIDVEVDKEGMPSDTPQELFVKYTNTLSATVADNYDNWGVIKLFEYILGFLKIIDRDQYYKYRWISLVDKEQIVNEVRTHGMRTLFPFNLRKNIRKVLQELEQCGVYNTTIIEVKTIIVNKQLIFYTDMSDMASIAGIDGIAISNVFGHDNILSIGNGATIGEHVIMSGTIDIQDTFTVGGDSSITGACAIGNNVTIGECVDVDRVQVSDDVEISDSATIMCYCEIGKSSHIGKGTIVQPHVKLGHNVKIGDGTVLHNHVDLRDHVKVGDVSVIHEHANMGYNVCIASHVTISSKTVIRRNTKINSGVVIGENNKVGHDSVIGHDYYEDIDIMGIKIEDKLSKNCPPAVRNDVTVGDNCTIGNHTNIREGVTIADDVSIGNETLILQNVKIDDDVSIGDNVSIGEDSSIGRDSDIGCDNSEEKEGIIGVNIGDRFDIGCSSRIDDGVSISDDCVIGDKTTIHTSVSIASSVTIGNESSIMAGVKLGMSVKIGDNVVINEGLEIAEHTVIANGANVVSSDMYVDDDSCTYSVCINDVDKVMYVTMDGITTTYNEQAYYFVKLLKTRVLTGEETNIKNIMHELIRDRINHEDNNT